MQCPNCNHELNEDDRFCSKCGQLLNKKSSQDDNKVIDVVQNEKNLSNQTTTKSNSNDSWLGCMGCLGLIFLVIIIFASCGSSSSNYDSDPTFYDTGDPNDMTNREMEDFLDWKDKQNQREWESQQFDGQ